MTEHIVKLLDAQAEHALNETDRAIIKAHIQDCTDCWGAYQAFRISGELLRKRAQEVSAPSPFFSTRVLAALNQNEFRQPLTFAAMWKATRGIVVSIVAFVAVLLALTSYQGDSAGPNDAAVATLADSLYSPEGVLVGNSTPDDLTNSQVLMTLYEPTNTYGDQR